MKTLLKEKTAIKTERKKGGTVTVRQSPPLISKSKYEFNLAEFPVSTLAKHLSGGPKVIEYQDTIVGKDGEIVPRTWKVSPSAEYGFGTTQALGTLFELFQIWKEQGFTSPVIRFGSIYNLCKRTGIENETTAYERIRKDLNALVGITIEAKNAFWDNEKKAYVDKVFHLFDEGIFYHEASRSQQLLPFAYIKASQTLWGSIAANAIITLRQVDSALFHSLTPTEQRLALYLGKMLHAATEHKRDVRTLASQLPLLAKQYKDLKKQLSKACDGLLAKGFSYLSAYHYERKRDGQGENIIFLRHATTDAAVENRAREDDGLRALQQKLLVQDILEVTGDHHSRSFYTLVTQHLDEQTIYRALAETRAAAHQGEIHTSRGRFFTDLVTRYAAERGIILNPKKRHAAAEELHAEG